MTHVRQILRCMQRLGQIKDGGKKLMNNSVRYASTMTKKKYVEGENGERIFRSPYGEINCPEMLIQDYVWRSVQNHENSIALECGVTGRKYTHGQSRDATNYIARSLSNMGLKKGDVVALIAPNYPETVLGFLGILEAGLVVTTVNPFYTVDEMSRQLQSSGAKAVITVAEIAPVALGAATKSLPQNSPFIVIEDGTGPIPDGTIPFKDLVVRGKELPPLKNTRSSPDDLAVLPYSSGTTGLPKGVMLTHRNLVANMEMMEVSSGDDLWQPTTESFQEVLPLILPFFHIFGMNGVTLPRLAGGARMIMIPKFIPQVFCKVLAQNKVTGLFCAPPIVLFLVASPAIKKEHFESLRLAVSGAAPLSKPDVERLYSKYNLNEETLKFCQGYGLTESSPVAFLEKTGTKYSSIGKSAASCEARLVDISTNEDISTPGQTGELWIRGPHIMKGYLNNESATRETIVGDGWLKTGDIAYFDEDLDFFITDRLKELIKVKGFQVPPAELESLLRTHPDVEEAAVIGIPDERCGEVPKAFVLPKSGTKPTAEDIQNFVKGKVSEYKELQGGVTFVDSIPKNPSGKILRMQLKTQYK